MGNDMETTWELAGVSGRQRKGRDQSPAAKTALRAMRPRHQAMACLRWPQEKLARAAAGAGEVTDTRRMCDARGRQGKPSTAATG
ncbi:hypothetical protein PR202_gb13073 [Eleusine coracana subsp. coracana]|uniref:Uncharacterized protein n=1 Tax=Eleusine coracana subsp. coracana TaxID=191504 RepID=A0AAV5EST4_ELECO|nr:hypothetical protein PR202_gb13073 [Eleusine coracana subsp. coracana]